MRTFVIIVVVCSLFQQASAGSRCDAKPGVVVTFQDIFERVIADQNLYISPREQWDKRGVLKKFDRKFVENYRYPNSTVGKIAHINAMAPGAFNTCTATMISPCHILTAKHCLPENKQQFETFRFHSGPGVVGQPSIESRAVKTSFAGASNSPEDDWAVVELDQRVGDITGWMGVAGNVPNAFYKNRSLNFIGFGSEVTGGETAATTTMTVSEAEGHAFLIGRELTKGDSGGPIWAYIGGKPIIFGVAARGESGFLMFPGFSYFAMFSKAGRRLSNLKNQCDGKPVPTDIHPKPLTDHG